MGSKVGDKNGLFSNLDVLGINSIHNLHTLLSAACVDCHVGHRQPVVKASKKCVFVALVT